MGHKASKSNIHVQSSENEQSSINKSCRCITLGEVPMNLFTLIWLDEKSNENTLDTLRTKILLRQLNNDHCVFIDHVSTFFLTIERLKLENRKILVIVSGSLAKTVLPVIQETVSTTIIFCNNYNKYAELIDKYSNVTDICTDHETLKNCIQREIPSLKLNLFRNQNLKSMKPLSASKDTFGNSGTYFSYLLFIELLKQIPSTELAKDVMLKKCKDYYRRNEKELKKIELFRSTYTADKAIDWYTEDCFIYRLVNQAFRTEDVALWYIFRFYIVDLCKQLEKIHQAQNIQNCLRLYRGQARMPTKELEILRTNVGGLILTNAFLSTSKSVEIAQQFILDAENSDDCQVVMFEIILDASQLKDTVFVDVDMYFKQSSESEILFNIGSVFRIQNVHYDITLNIWKIHMEATDEGKQDILHSIDVMSRKFHNRNINLLFGRLLIDMHQLVKAESYFQMMLRELPNHHEDLPSVYDHIADINMRISNWNEAFLYLNAAYEIKKIKYRCNHPNLAVTLNSIGNYYKAIGDVKEALRFYWKALKCKNDLRNTAITKLNIGTIQTIDGEYENALDQCIEARDILEQYHPRPHTELVQCQGIIGDIYFAQRCYTSAEHFYITAFELSKIYLLIDDPIRTNCVKALVDVYREQGHIDRAVAVCLEQISFIETHLQENHPNIAHLVVKLAEIYTKDYHQQLNLLKRALHIFETNIHLQYAATSTCLLMLAQCYTHHNELDQVSTCYMRALELQEKIFPKNHPIIIETRKLTHFNDGSSN